MSKEGLTPKLRPAELLHLWCTKYRKPHDCHDTLAAVLWRMIEGGIISIDGDSFMLTKKDNYGLSQFQQGCRWYEHLALDAIVSKSMQNLFAICHGRLVRRELILMGILETHKRKILWTIPTGTRELLTENAQKALERVPEAINEPAELLAWVFETTPDKKFKGLVNTIIHDGVWNEEPALRTHL